MLRDLHAPVSAALQQSANQLMRLALFSGAINLLTLSGSIYMLQVYDRVIPSRSLETLVALSLILVLAYLLQGYLDALRGRMLARVGALFEVGLQEPLYRALVSRPLQGLPSQQLRQPMLDIESIRGFLAGAGPTALLDVPWTPLFLIVLFAFHPLIGATALAGAIAIPAVTILTERRSAELGRNAGRCMAERSVMADATLRNADVIRAMGMRPALFVRWMRVNERSLDEAIGIMDVHAVMGASAKMIRYGLQSAILGVGAYLVIRGQASGGIMIASSIVMGRALAPMEIALASWRQLSAARKGLHRLGEDLPAAEPVVDRQLADPERDLSVHNLGLAVPGEGSPILAGISFKVEAGDGLAILGPSGSGKSSLARTLVGVWTPSGGSISLDGTPLEQWDADQLGRRIGYLPQNVALFDGTVAENIARFEPNASPQSVMRAATLAQAHEMILRLPNGYHTRIGEDGSRLSSGQRQRIGLARAVYRNPLLVILDEPNSNLDKEGETALYSAIVELKKQGSIVIVVTHRPEALKHLDKMLVLVKGRMIAFGAHEQVGAALARLSKTATSPSNVNPNIQAHAAAASAKVRS